MYLMMSFYTRMDIDNIEKKDAILFEIEDLL